MKLVIIADDVKDFLVTICCHADIRMRYSHSLYRTSKGYYPSFKVITQIAKYLPKTRTGIPNMHNGLDKR